MNDLSCYVVDNIGRIVLQPFLDEGVPKVINNHTPGRERNPLNYQHSHGV
jgi:hypothetical protein